MSKLICPDCQHENEPERIYCHSCGARLDRTKLIQEKGAKVESEEVVQKRLKKMFDPRRGQTKQLALKLLRVLAGACLVAALIVMVLPPPGLPPEQKNYSFAPMINMDLVSAISSAQPATLVYNEEQVNSYLASNLRRKDSPASQGFFPLRRILVRFSEGECGVNVRNEIFGLPIYSGASYGVRLDKGKILAQARSGYIGRMAIHPSLARATDFLLQKAWVTLDRERKSVARLAGIEFHPQSVTLVAGR